LLRPDVQDTEPSLREGGLFGSFHCLSFYHLDQWERENNKQDIAVCEEYNIKLNTVKPLFNELLGD
jgi:hypothetical protein